MANQSNHETTSHPTRSMKKTDHSYIYRGFIKARLLHEVYLRSVRGRVCVKEYSLCSLFAQPKFGQRRCVSYVAAAGRLNHIV